MKYLFFIFIAFIFTGCETMSYSTQNCKSKGWNGIVIKNYQARSYIRCSNGYLSPDKKNFITHNGLYDVDNHEYLPFKK